MLILPLPLKQISVLRTTLKKKEYTISNISVCIDHLGTLINPLGAYEVTYITGQRMGRYIYLLDMIALQVIGKKNLGKL